MINLGIVGAGKFAEKYVNTILELDGVKIVAYARQMPSVSSYMPEGSILYTDWRSMIDQPLDGVIVCADPKITADVSHYALSKSIPVMAEKPLAMSLREVARLSPVAKRAPLLVNHIHLFSSAYETMKKMIDPSDIEYIESEGTNSGPIRSFSSLYDYGPHDASMCMDLLGCSPDVISCFATQYEHGQLFDLIMNFTNASTYSRVGNGGSERVRTLSVKCGDTIYIYDDGTKDKLFMDGSPIPISPEQPLKRAIKLWLRSIRSGVTDDRFGIGMALRVAAVLDLASKQL